MSSEIWWHGPKYLEDGTFDSDSLNFKPNVENPPELKKVVLPSTIKEDSTDLFLKFLKNILIIQSCKECLLIPYVLFQT